MSFQGQAGSVATLLKDMVWDFIGSNSFVDIYILQKLLYTYLCRHSDGL